MNYSFFVFEQVIFDYTKVRVSLTIKEEENGTSLSIRPKSVQLGKGFSIDCLVGWRSIKAKLNIEKFGKPILEAFSQTDLFQRSDCASYLKTLQKRTKVKLVINESIRKIDDPSSWPQNWEYIEITQDSGPLTIDKMNENEIISRIIPHFAAVVGLLKFKQEDLEIDKGYPEGAKTKVEVNRYERNPLNRQLCIDHFGHLCQACEENLQVKYGELAKGFIHVHHVVPVSKLEENYIIDPIKDLIPLCPNCHAIVHRTNPPLQIEKLRMMVMENKVEYRKKQQNED